jgi:hypothetical protein
MFKFRYITPEGTHSPDLKFLQIKQTHVIVRMGGVDYKDMVLHEIENPVWKTVETICDSHEFSDACKPENQLECEDK